MAIPQRVKGAGTFFVTSATWERRRVFQLEANARLFLSKLESYREAYLLHAYVVMPDHVHVLLTPGQASLERVVQLVKGGFSHARASKFPVWQRGFSDHRIRDARDAAKHVHYIEQNPVGAHLAQYAWEYPFSSSHATALKLDALPSHLRMPPRGLKPLAEPAAYGTAEAVPFQESSFVQPAKGSPSTRHSLADEQDRYYQMLHPAMSPKLTESRSANPQHKEDENGNCRLAAED